MENDIYLMQGEAEVLRYDLSVCDNINTSLITSGCVSGTVDSIDVEALYVNTIPCKGVIQFNTDCCLDDFIEYNAVDKHSFNNYTIHFEQPTQLSGNYLPDTEVIVNGGVLDLTNYDFNFEVWGLSGDVRAQYISKGVHNTNLLQDGVVLINLDSNDTNILPQNYKYYLTMSKNGDTSFIVKGNFYIKEK